MAFLRRRRLVAAIPLLAVVAAAVPAAVAAPPDRPVEVTGTARGRAVAVEAAGRHRALGVPARADRLRVWRLPDGSFLVGERLPDNLRTSTREHDDGSIDLDLSFDVGDDGGGPRTAALDGAVTAASPTWQWREQACFSRLGNAAGWLDSCYALHKLVNETNARDFYKLEQYGTVGATPFGKIYNGWLAANRATGSAPMAWVDWDPRENVNGRCVRLDLEIVVLGVGFSNPALFCENNIPHKGEAAGSFRMEWSCGCIVPFGQPYPNSREIDYLQAISVPNGGAPRWTLSAGLHAL